MSKVRNLFSNTEAEAEATQTGYSLRRGAVPEAFTIDGETRIITPPANFKYLGVESDEKSNRVYFECPQYVGDNIDLATCVLRINFKNAKGVLDGYVVDDLESDGSNIHFSWKLGRNVTKYKGTVSFIVCATITNKYGEILTEWNTTLCTGEVLEGLEVDNPEAEESTLDLVTQLVNMVGSKVDKSDIVTDYEEWFEKSDGSDFNTKVPSIGVISKFLEESGYLSEGNINAEINPDADADSYTHFDIPNVGAVINYVDAQMNRASEKVLPEILEPNKEYNLGMMPTAVLLFPENANDGDVIYVVFTAGTPEDTVDIAINKDFTSGLTDFTPEAGKKYEIYGRYDSIDAIWLCGYSEY